MAGKRVTGMTLWNCQAYPRSNGAFISRVIAWTSTSSARASPYQGSSSQTIRISPR
jgi:hypothetical protein